MKYHDSSNFKPSPALLRKRKYQAKRKAEIKKEREYLESLTDEEAINKFGGKEEEYYWNLSAHTKLYNFISNNLDCEKWREGKYNRYINKLRKQLESKFHRRMNWANFLTYKWQIDHIIPKKYIDTETGKIDGRDPIIKKYTCIYCDDTYFIGMGRF